MNLERLKLPSVMPNTRNDGTSTSSDTDDEAIKQQAEAFEVTRLQEATAHIISLHDNATPRERAITAGMLSTIGASKDAPVDVLFGW